MKLQHLAMVISRVVQACLMYTCVYASACVCIIICMAHLYSSSFLSERFFFSESHAGRLRPLETLYTYGMKLQCRCCLIRTLKTHTHSTVCCDNAQRLLTLTPSGAETFMLLQPVCRSAGQALLLRASCNFGKGL